MERRDALKLIGASLILGGGLISARALSAKEEKVPPLPWPYKKLDPEKVAERAYLGYYKGGCCYGAFDSIVGSLQDTVGYPYTGIPTELFVFGEGGVAGVSSLCGAVLGSSAAIFLLTGALEKEKREKSFELIKDLFNFYEQEALPKYVPKNPKVTFEMKTSVSKSPLCHVSVTRWCKVSGYKAFSKERSERCGRLTADCALYALKLVESYLAGTFKEGYLLSQEVKKCRSCHDKGGALENTRGLMDCSMCHFTGKKAKHP